MQPSRRQLGAGTSRRFSAAAAAGTGDGTGGADGGGAEEFDPDEDPRKRAARAAMKAGHTSLPGYVGECKLAG